jgi:predicted S18 family serine protease
MCCYNNLMKRVLAKIRESRRVEISHPLLVAAVAVMVWLGAAGPSEAMLQGKREQLISILGVTIEEDERRAVGTVANLIVSFEERDDTNGLIVHFRTSPGRFSPMAQTAVQQAIHRTARAAGLTTDSWTVVLSVPHPGVTIYGDSLSAMVGLSVLALAKGQFIPFDRAMTGTISPDGRISPVGSVSLKVIAANEAHLRRVLVPDEQDMADSDWHTPFLMTVSPVSSIGQAYQALTDQPLFPADLAAR